MTQRIVVIGGVAAGPKAAARARRLDPTAQITILEKGPTASYGACGFPYYVGGSVSRIQELMETPAGTLRDAVFFDKVKDVDLRTATEATAIRRETKQVVCRDVQTDETIALGYDKLIVATGATPTPPPIPGLERANVFALKTYEDAERLRGALDQITDHLKARDIGGLQHARPLRVGIIGAGLIGLEVAETLRIKGEVVTVVERLPQMLPNADVEIAAHLERQAEAHGVRVIIGTQVEEILGEGDLATGMRLSNETIPIDLILVATGIRPEVTLARDAGLAIGPTGAIQVDSTMRTSDPDIYAAGDCAEKRHLVTGAPCWIPLGSTANKEGRVAGANAAGHAGESFPGVSGSLVMRFFDLTVARTGLGEGEARQAGFDVETVLLAGPDKPHFMADAAPILLKLVVDRASRRLLGVQGVGMGEVARRVDAAVAPIAVGMTVDQVAALDLVYAPPYAPPVDVLISAANAARNKLDGVAKGLGPSAYRELVQRGEAPLLVDVRSPAEHESLPFGTSLLIPLGALRQRAGEIPDDRPVVLLCKIGLRGYEGQRILEGLGYENVHLIEGGVVGWPYPDL